MLPGTRLRVVNPLYTKHVHPGCYAINFNHPVFIVSLPAPQRWPLAYPGLWYSDLTNHPDGQLKNEGHAWNCQPKTWKNSEFPPYSQVNLPFLNVYCLLVQDSLHNGRGWKFILIFLKCMRNNEPPPKPPSWITLFPGIRNLYKSILDLPKQQFGRMLHSSKEMADDKKSVCTLYALWYSAMYMPWITVRQMPSLLGSCIRIQPKHIN